MPSNKIGIADDQIAAGSARDRLAREAVPEVLSTDSMTVNEKIERLWDKSEIQNRLGLYSIYVDGRQFENWVSLFTEDCLFEIRDADGEEILYQLSTRTGLLAGVRDLLGHSPPAGFASYHHQSCLVFDQLTADRAATRSLVLTSTHQITPDPSKRPLPLDLSASVHLGGVYHDRWRKADGEWKFAHRMFVPGVLGQWPEQG